MASREVNWAQSCRTLLTIASMVVLFGHKGKSLRGRIASFRWERETTESQRDMLKILLALPVAIRDGDELMKMND